MLDRGELQMNCRVKRKHQEEIAVVDIPYDEVNVEIPISPLVIEFPAPFAYKDEKAVPWIYHPRAFKQGQEDRPLMINEPNATSNVGPAGMTRSGRVFAPRTADTSAKAKGKEVVVQIPIPNQEMQDMHLSPKVAATREEAEEFLRIINMSDYKVVDQLNQTPSKISMLSLFLNSEAHRNSLLKVYFSPTELSVFFLSEIAFPCTSQVPQFYPDLLVFLADVFVSPTESSRFMEFL